MTLSRPVPTFAEFRKHFNPHTVARVYEQTYREWMVTNGIQPSFRADLHSTAPIPKRRNVMLRENEAQERLRYLREAECTEIRTPIDPEKRKQYEAAMRVAYKRLIRMYGRNPKDYLIQSTGPVDDPAE